MHKAKFIKQGKAAAGPKSRYQGEEDNALLMHHSLHLSKEDVPHSMHANKENSKNINNQTTLIQSQIHNIYQQPPSSIYQ